MVQHKWSSPFFSHPVSLSLFVYLDHYLSVRLFICLSAALSSVSPSLPVPLL